MDTLSAAKPRLSNLAAVIAFIAVAFALVVASASTASAHFSGAIGRPGAYNITADKYNKQIMIEGWVSWDKPTFYTAGATVGPAPGSANAQTVTATYKLERWSFDLNTFVLMQQATKSKLIPGYVSGVPSTSVALGGYLFENPPVVAEKTIYRVSYKIEWFDNLGHSLGYRDVYPDAYNNFCPQSTERCTVYNPGIEWNAGSLTS